MSYPGLERLRNGIVSMPHPANIRIRRRLPDVIVFSIFIVCEKPTAKITILSLSGKNRGHNYPWHPDDGCLSVLVDYFHFVGEVDSAITVAVRRIHYTQALVHFRHMQLVTAVPLRTSEIV